MKKQHFTLIALTTFLSHSFMAQGQDRYFQESEIQEQEIPDRASEGRLSLLKGTPATKALETVEDKESTKKENKIPYQIGAIIHMFGAYSQGEITAQQAADPNFQNSYSRSFNVYRARLMFGAQLSKKGNVFIETEIPRIIGSGTGDNKNMEVPLMVLDAQYEHVFSNYFSVIAGQMLVSHNRNGLQGAATLMANDFTHYQYPYNMWEDSPLQGYFGRDVGINTRGFLAQDRLEYRLGVFTGRRFDGGAPARYVGRLVYNFLDPEKDFYYNGTGLGMRNTFALAGGFDVQGTYRNIGLDAYLDIPIGDNGALTVNAAHTNMTGGISSSQYNFTELIPRQNIQFLEMGYYFKRSQLQPWIKYENQSINGHPSQLGLPHNASEQQLNDANLIGSNQRAGFGINYFFNAYTTNLRLSYTQVTYGREAINGGAEKDSYGQLWLQLQLFVF